MANKVTIDSRETGCIVWQMDHSVSDVLTWTGVPTLDTGYTITLDADSETQLVFTVGSGITLDVPTNAIAWAFDTSAIANKTWTGQIISDSLAVGTYFKNDITVKFN